MSSYTGPVLLVVLGTLIVVATSHGFSRQVRARGTDQSFSSRVLLVIPLVLAAYALYGVLRAIWGGQDNWWAWLGALAVQLLAVYHGQRARERFFEATALERFAPSEDARTRSRFICLYFGLAFAALLVVALVLPDGGAAASAWRVTTSAVLFVVSMICLCAATWSSVWVFRVRDPHR